MEYTLISSLGTGMYKKEGGYRKTIYVFEESKEIESHLFLNAVLKSQLWNVKKIILIGTRTSSWDILIDETKYEDLWLDVKDQCETDGITDETLIQLQSMMAEEKKIEITLKVHSAKLDDDSVEEIFNVYNTIESDIKPKTKVLFDITHGFRSMPVLIYQALQFAAANRIFENVELIYGEFIDQQKKSFVRNLSKYWEITEITKAVNEFEAKLDGRYLAEKIKTYWERGSKVLLRFSEIVSLNFSLQIYDMLKQLKNSLNDDLTEAPLWVQSVKKELSVIYNRLNKNTVSSVLFEYALFLEEKRLYTQAVIALQVCVETIAAEHNGLNYEQFGDYDWMQNYGKDTLYKLKGMLTKNTRAAINDIEFFRNQIAHGGAKDKKTGNFPNAANLKNILAGGKKAIGELMEAVES